MNFLVPITIHIQHIFKCNIAYAQIICLIWCVVPILYGFPSVRISIMVSQKCQYRQILGAVSKDQPPKYGNIPIQTYRLVKTKWDRLVCNWVRDVHCQGWRRQLGWIWDLVSGIEKIPSVEFYIYYGIWEITIKLHIYLVFLWTGYNLHYPEYDDDLWWVTQKNMLVGRR